MYDVKKVMAALLCCTSCAPMPVKAAEPQTWAVYYNDKLPGSAFRDYHLVVFDQRYHPDITALRHANTTLLAYVSAGELHGERTTELEILKGQEAILQHNKVWGSHVVNLTSATWRSMVLTQVSDALDQGFDGVMIDTIDSPLYAAAKLSEETFEANRAAAIQLISDIRTTYPRAKIMLNRGMDILPEVAENLDYALAESILSETNIKTGKSKLFPPTAYQQMAGIFHEASERSPQLKVYTLDYWNPEDVAGIKRIYAVQRENGFYPYVTTPDLQTLSPEPHGKPTRSRAQADLAVYEDHHA